MYLQPSEYEIEWMIQQQQQHTKQAAKRRAMNKMNEAAYREDSSSSRHENNPDIDAWFGYSSQSETEAATSGKEDTPQMDTKGMNSTMVQPQSQEYEYTNFEQQFYGDGDEGRVIAAAPLTISDSSWVIAAWRALLYTSCSSSIRSPAFSVAFFIANIRAACSQAPFSTTAWYT